MECVLIDYQEKDAITTFMKHSNTQLPYDKGKFITKNIWNLRELSDRQFLFITAQHVSELETFTRVCFPIKTQPWPDLRFDVREVMREERL